MKITGFSYINNEKLVSGEKLVARNENLLTFADFIKHCYKLTSSAYPKFYKMDKLCKLGFVVSEALLKDSGFVERYGRDEIGIVLCNSASTADTDRDFQLSVASRENYFPSPSVFVYTLPNIVIGEICIRNGLCGENALWVTPGFDARLIHEQCMLLFEKNRMKAAICGYADIDSENYNAMLFLVEKNADNSYGEFVPQEIEKMYNHLSRS